MPPKHFESPVSAPEPILERAPPPTTTLDPVRAARIAIEERGEACALFDHPAYAGEKPRLISHMNEADKERMATSYESVDSADPQTQLYQDYCQRVRSRDPRWFFWAYVAVIAFLCAVFATIMVMALHRTFTVKTKLLELGLTSYDSAQTESTLSASRNFGAGYCMWIAFGLACSLLVGIVAYAIPASVGSGLPEVIACLNGVDNKNLSSLKLFFAKVISCLFSVSAGLPVGFYGAIVLGGTMLGAAVNAQTRGMRSRYFASFRNARDQRFFTIIGAAVGITAAFGVPMGGVMFIMEHLSSAFPIRLALYVFVASMLCAFTMQITHSYFDAFELRRREGMNTGDLFADVLVQFDVNVMGLLNVPVNFMAFVPAAVTGAICGVLAVLFIRLDRISWRLRRAYLIKAPRLAIITPCIFFLLYGTASYWTSKMVGSGVPDGCHSVPVQFDMVRNSSIVAYYGLSSQFCMSANASEPPIPSHQVFHLMESLSMGFPDSTAQVLLSWNTNDVVRAKEVAVYLLLYFFFAATVSLIPVSSDGLLPSLVIGAGIGRLIGMITHVFATEAFGKEHSQRGWADPGVFALIGAASFLGATQHLTFSIAVILIEITNDLEHCVCVMLGISIARAITDRFAKSIAMSHLEANCVPLLDFGNYADGFGMYNARDIMHPGCEVAHLEEKVSKVVDLLLTTTHHAFPVASKADSKFLGLVARSHLQALLWNVHTNRKTSFDSLQELKEMEEEILLNRWEGCPPVALKEWGKTMLDLTPVLDRSAVSMRGETCLSRVYHVFTALGLRHLVVVDRQNRAIGMITRKDLRTEAIIERAGYYDEQKLQHTANFSSPLTSQRRISEHQHYRDLGDKIETFRGAPTRLLPSLYGAEESENRRDPRASQLSRIIGAGTSTKQPQSGDAKEATPLLRGSLQSDSSKQFSEKQL